jgi:Xaa-Pro aminopeptidase
MLTAAGCASRRDRLWAALPAPCDFLIVGDPSHLAYFAGYSPSPFVFRTVESAAALLLQPGSSTLVADDMLSPFLDQTFVDERIAPVWYDGEHSAPYRRGQLVESALGRLARMPGKRVGIELAGVPAGLVEGLRAARPNLEIVDIGPLMRPLRRKKDADEIALLRRSMHAGEAGLAAAHEKVRPGMTELDVYLIVQNAAMTALGEQVIVYGDFASGPRCERDKGGPPTSRRIETGDLVLIDFSVIVAGYRGDFTNTFAVGGGPTSRQRELFEACVGALRAGEASLNPGTPARDVDAAVRGHFASLGLDQYFPTHSGHGLGLGHPEPPYFVRESRDTLEAGDVVALEPGLYVDGVGGMRYERNYLITPRGPETLSNHQISIDQS